jgi:hypothetical protein
MKTKFILAALALFACLAVSTTASAQIYAAQSLTVPTILAAGTTNLATPPTLGALKQQNVSLAATITASATTTNIYTLNRSVDGVNWDTNSVNLSYFVASTTGSQVTTTTNISAAGYGYLRIATIQTIGGTVTNGTHNYGVKIAAP